MRFLRSFFPLRAPKAHDAENDGADGDGSSLEGALKPAGAEPSDAELAGLLGLKTESAARPAKPAKAKAKAADLDEDPDAEDLSDGDDDGAGEAAPSAGKAKAKAKPAAADDDDEADTDAKTVDPLTAAQRAAAGIAGEDEEDDDTTDDDSTEDDAPDADPADGTSEEDDDAALDAEAAATRGAFTPKQQARFDKAIAKKTKRILDLREELSEERAEKERLASELETVRKSPAPAAAATPENPLADIDDEAKLDARLGDARKLRRFALTNPDGAYVETKTGQVVEVPEGDDVPAGVVHFTKRRIGEILADSEELLQEHGPKRRAFLQQRTKDEASALTAVPWLKNKNSRGSIDIETRLRESPALRTVPGIRLLLADAFIGRHLRTAAEAGKAKPGAAPAAPGKTKAPPSPGGGTRAPRVDGKRKAAGDALLTVAKTGADPDNAGLRAILQT